MKIDMKHIKTFILISIFCWLSSEIYAQKMTEIYIPVGQSPGVSGKYSLLGRVEAVNRNDSTVTIIKESGSKTTFRITAGCAIYLDKNKLKLRNSRGYCADIKPGMKAEAKYKDNKPDGPIEWLKIQIE